MRNIAHQTLIILVLLFSCLESSFATSIRDNIYIPNDVLATIKKFNPKYTELLKKIDNRIFLLRKAKTNRSEEKIEKQKLKYDQTNLEKKIKIKLKLQKPINDKNYFDLELPLQSGMVLRNFYQFNNSVFYHELHRDYTVRVFDIDLLTGKKTEINPILGLSRKRYNLESLKRIDEEGSYEFRLTASNTYRVQKLTEKEINRLKNYFEFGLRPNQLDVLAKIFEQNDTFSQECRGDFKVSLSDMEILNFGSIDNDIKMIIEKLLPIK